MDMEEDSELLQFRRKKIREINSEAIGNKQLDRLRLEFLYGKDNVWDTTEFTERFEILGFMAPYVVVVDKVIGEKGSCEFCHSPRFYFNYKKDEKGEWRII